MTIGTGTASYCNILQRFYTIFMFHRCKPWCFTGVNSAWFLTHEHCTSLCVAVSDLLQSINGTRAALNWILSLGMGNNSTTCLCSFYVLLECICLWISVLYIYVCVYIANTLILSDPLTLNTPILWCESLLLRAMDHRHDDVTARKWPNRWSHMAQAWPNIYETWHVDGEKKTYADTL